MDTCSQCEEKALISALLPSQGRCSFCFRCFAKLLAMLDVSSIDYKRIKPIMLAPVSPPIIDLEYEHAH